MYKRIYQKVLLTMAMIALLLCGVLGMQEYMKKTTIQNSTTNASDIKNNFVYLGGMPAGIYMKTDGIMVIGTEEIEGTDHLYHEPAAHIVKSGDYITAINHVKTKDKKALTKQLQKNKSKEVVLSIRRKNQMIDVEITPVKAANGKYLFGIWVRDDIQGLGTITYIDSKNQFAALGHGIHDTDTNELLEISKGVLYRTRIRSILKGNSGSPGSMEGIIIYNRYHELGIINKNTETGIYGSIPQFEQMFQDRQLIQTATIKEIKTGDATVRCQVTDEIKDYRIKIVKLDYSAHEINKGMTIEITDPELLSITGGIVQGMSGSPIIQNKKIVGAVTHVFIKNSKKGYGIFIQNMLHQNKS